MRPLISKKSFSCIIIGSAVMSYIIKYVIEKLGISEQLDSIRFCEAHEERVDVLFDRAFLQQRCKGMGGIYQRFVLWVCGDNNPAGIEIVVQSLGFP